MKEKIKIVCLVLIVICLIIITIAVLTAVDSYVQKEEVYLNAYNDCIRAMQYSPISSWTCVGILSGKGD